MSTLNPDSNVRTCPNTAGHSYMRMGKPMGTDDYFWTFNKTLPGTSGRWMDIAINSCTYYKTLNDTNLLDKLFLAYLYK